MSLTKYSTAGITQGMTTVRLPAGDQDFPTDQGLLHRVR